MTLNANYVVTSDVDTYFVNKDTGQALSNGSLIFYRDSARNVPKPVFELSGAPPNYTYTSMGAIVTLSNAGTVQDATGANEVIYYYPYINDPVSGLPVLDLYYVVCEDANGVVQFTREAWPNLADSTTSSTQVVAPLNNQISNPNFTNISLTDALPTNISVTGAVSQRISFAPDWDVVISGTGSVILQRIAISGFDTVVTNPPYVLDISIGVGITSCLISQKFNYNSGLWSTNNGKSVYLTGSLIAQNQVGGTSTIQMFYAQSNGSLASSPVQILSGSVSATYTLIQGGTSSAIPSSNDPNKGSAGFVDVYISIPVNSHIRLSSIQLIPTFATSQVIPYNLDSSNRSEAYQGDYYIPNLSARGLPSYLVGWDFTTSPYQTGNNISSITPTAQYITDQTVAACSSSFLTYGTNGVTKGLQVNLIGAPAFYIMQYINPLTIVEMFENPLCVNVFGYASSATAPITMRVYLFSGPAPGSTLPMGTVAANGVFTPNFGWTEISRSGLPVATSILNVAITNPDINNGTNDFGFNGWKTTGSFFGVTMVITFSVPSASGTNPSVIINSVSLAAGNVPARPAFKTPDEVLRQCQVYYQTSFPPNGTFGPGAGRPGGQAYGLQSPANVIPANFPAPAMTIGAIQSFSVQMRASPVVTLYNPTVTGGVNEIYNLTRSAAWTGSIATSTNINGFTAASPTPVSGSVTGDYNYVNWVADARLGLIP